MDLLGLLDLLGLFSFICFKLVSLEIPTYYFTDLKEKVNNKYQDKSIQSTAESPLIILNYYKIK